MKGVRDWGAVIVTVVISALTFWWLALVAEYLGERPVIEGGVLVLDRFQRAKDVFALMLPLFSAAVAYWLGSREAQTAREQQATVTRQMFAVLAAAPSGVLNSAQTSNPEVFRDWKARP